jgi:hypothetical protein
MLVWPLIFSIQLPSYFIARWRIARGVSGGIIDPLAAKIVQPLRVTPSLSNGFRLAQYQRHIIAISPVLPAFYQWWYYYHEWVHRAVPGFLRIRFIEERIVAFFDAPFLIIALIASFTELLKNWRSPSDLNSIPVARGGGKARWDNWVVPEVAKENLKPGERVLLYIGGAGEGTAQFKFAPQGMIRIFKHLGIEPMKMAFFSIMGPMKSSDPMDTFRGYDQFKTSLREYLDLLPQGNAAVLVGICMGGRLLMDFMYDKENAPYMEKIDVAASLMSPIRGFGFPGVYYLIDLLLPWVSRKIYPRYGDKISQMVILGPLANYPVYINQYATNPDYILSLGKNSAASLRHAHPLMYGDRNDDGSVYIPSARIVCMVSGGDNKVGAWRYQYDPRAGLVAVIRGIVPHLGVFWDGPEHEEIIGNPAVTKFLSGILSGRIEVPYGQSAPVFMSNKAPYGLIYETIFAVRRLIYFLTRLGEYPERMILMSIPEKIEDDCFGEIIPRLLSAG